MCRTCSLRHYLSYYIYYRSRPRIYCGRHPVQENVGEACQSLYNLSRVAYYLLDPDRHGLMFPST